MAAASAAAVPADASHGRSAYFRSLVFGRDAVFVMLIGGGGLFLLGAKMADVRIWAGGPALLALLIVLVAWRSAHTRAESEFFLALSRSLGLEYLAHGHLPALTPLLGAGDRRSLKHVMTGRLGPEGVPLTLAHYTYEVRRTYGTDGTDNEVERWEPHHFTICAFDVEQVLVRFRGIFVRRRRGIFEPAKDWLNRLEPVRAELESTAFNETYDFLLAREQDPIVARQLFAPSLTDWFARHPLQPGMELRAGTLAVFLPGHVDESAKLTWFFEGACELARRVVKDGAEAASVPLTAT